MMFNDVPVIPQSRHRHISQLDRELNEYKG